MNILLSKMEKQLNSPKNFNKYAYITFVMAGFAFLFLKDWSNVIIFIGLALVFDPFNPNLSFPKRSNWQKAILLGHVLIVLTALVLDIF